MVLSDVDIRRYLAEGKIKITPELPAEQFGSCSVDFRLGAEFNVFEHSRHAYIDLRDRRGIEDLMKPVMVAEGEPFILQPREFVLAITEECLELDADVLGRLEGRSSLGRIGIIVHGTAGLFDPGWSGRATLELSNLGPDAGGALSGDAHLFVHLRTALDAVIGALREKERKQIRGTGPSGGEPVGW